MIRAARLALFATACGLALWTTLAAAGVASSTPSLTLNPTSGLPNAKVSLSGTGFPPNEIVGLYLDSPNLFLQAPGPRADAQGAFTTSITVPGASPGAHQVCGDTAYPGAPPQQPAKACAQFVVIAGPSPTPSPSPSPTPSAGSTAGQWTFTIAAIAILIVAALVTGWWARRSG